MNFFLSYIILAEIFAIRALFDQSPGRHDRDILGFAGRLMGVGAYASAARGSAVAPFPVALVPRSCCAPCSTWCLAALATARRRLFRRDLLRHAARRDRRLHQLVGLTGGGRGIVRRAQVADCSACGGGFASFLHRGFDRGPRSRLRSAIAS